MTSAKQARSSTDARRGARKAVPGSATWNGASAPLPVRDRRPGYIALAIVLIVGLAALGAYWYSKAGAKTPVVVVVQDVPAGHVIARSDLSTVDVAGGVTAIAGSNLDSVVGQVATVELLPNTLLQRSMVSTASPLPADAAMVGVALKPGQLPANGLRDGATVEVLQLPARDTSGAANGSQTASVLVAAATVFATAIDPSQSGGTLATLIVPKAAAGGVAAASNAGLLALVVVSR